MNTRFPPTKPSSKRVTQALLALCLTVLPGCAGWAVTGATVASLGSGAAGYRCYGYVQVTPVAGLGTQVCDATVVATSAEDVVELPACGHAPLSEGTYVIETTHPSYTPATSEVVVGSPRGLLTSSVLGRAAPGLRHP